jgi:hypothetical protein
MTVVQGIPHPAFGSYHNNPSINEDSEFPYIETDPSNQEKPEEISSFYESASTNKKPESSFYSTLTSKEKPELSSPASVQEEAIFTSPYIIKPIKGKTLEKVLAQICDADRIANLCNKIYLDYMQLTIEEQKKLVEGLAKMMVWEACIITGVGVLEGGAAIGSGFSEQLSNSLLTHGIHKSAKQIESQLRGAEPILKRGGDAYSMFSRSQQSKLDMVKNNVERIVQGRILEAMSKLSNLSNQYNQSATSILERESRSKA